MLMLMMPRRPYMQVRAACSRGLQDPLGLFMRERPAEHADLAPSGVLRDEILPNSLGRRSAKEWKSDLVTSFPERKAELHLTCSYG